MTNQAIPIDADELKRLRESHAELMLALAKIMETIRYESGELSDDPMAPFAFDAEWERIAIAADAALANAAKVTAGFGEALELTRKAVKP